MTSNNIIRNFMILMVIILLPSKMVFGQNNILLNGTRYETSEEFNIQLQDYCFAKTETGGLFIFKMTFSQAGVEGTVKLYLESGDIITMYDRNIRETINSKNYIAYRLTYDEIEKLKKFNIDYIKYTYTEFYGEEYINHRSNETEENQTSFHGSTWSTDVPKIARSFFKTKYSSNKSYSNINTIQKNKSANKSLENTDNTETAYLAITSASVNFRTLPKSNSSILRKLSIGEDLFVLSSVPVNNFYSVIYIKTGEKGYVHKNYVKLTEIVPSNSKPVFKKTGKTSNSTAEITIFNNTSKTLSLNLGDRSHIFTPFKRITINIKPGNMQYLATAPGVIPLRGSQQFEGYNKYDWEFYIEH